MSYFSEKPANIIGTNGMFILDEHADLKSYQIGGTLGLSSHVSDSFMFDTYLYLKGVDNNGDIAYVKFTINPRNKVLLFPEMTRIQCNKDGKVISKTCYYTIWIAETGANVSYFDTSNDQSVCFYIASFFDDTVHYPNVEDMLNEIKSNGYFGAEIVKQPEIYALFGSEIIE